ncbi:MAG TPA: hypothetical protein VL460_10820 [Caulobacteraceae bacterium]|jgi:hypothetical protein|nr:hypothetical protein [Caulobacteraceae bacterium]
MKQGTGFSTLGATLRRLFRAEERPRPAPNARTAGRTERIQDTSLPVGRFSLVGLTELRAHLGPRWPDLSDRVHAVATAVIERHLLPGDVFESSGEDGYVVLFAQLRQREADFKCRMIGKEIAERLLGSEWKELSKVESACAEVSAAALMDSDLDSVLEDAFSAVERHHPLQAPAAPAEPCATGAPAPAGPRLAPDEARPETPAFGPPAGGLSAAPISKPSADWCYQPVWDFAQSAIIFFRLVHADEVGDEAAAAMSLDARFARDCWALKKAITDILTLSGHDKRLPIVCPIRAAGLDSGGRGRAIGKLVGVLPPHLRRVLTLELTAPPAWPGVTPLHSTISMLKALKVGVWARLPIDARAFDLMNPEFGLITAQLPRTNPPEAECMKALDTFAARAKASSLACGVAGVSTRSLALAASAAGFRYLSGRAIRGEVRALEQATRYDLARLYRDVALEASA